MREIPKSRYEEIKKCNFYKKYMGYNMHLCTFYGVSGNKNAPLWKRMLSHVYVIAFFKIVDEQEK